MIDQLVELLGKTRAELQPVLAVVVAGGVLLGRLLKNPATMARLTIVNRQLRAWTVAAFAFVLCLALEIVVLHEYEWPVLAAVGVLVAGAAVVIHLIFPGATSPSPDAPASPPNRGRGNG